MNISINLIMYISILILKRCRINNLISWFFTLFLTFFGNLCIKLILLFKFQRICMLAGIFNTVICLHGIFITKISKLFIPCHSSIQIYRYYELTLVSVFINLIKTVFIYRTKVHICCLNTNSS